MTSILPGVAASQRVGESELYELPLVEWDKGLAGVVGSESYTSIPSGVTLSPEDSRYGKSRVVASSWKPGRYVVVREVVTRGSPSETRRRSFILRVTT